MEGLFVPDLLKDRVPVETDTSSCFSRAPGLLSQSCVYLVDMGDELLRAAEIQRAKRTNKVVKVVSPVLAFLKERAKHNNTSTLLLHRLLRHVPQCCAHYGHSTL